mmetsp:Transcript_11317/g.18324  ORF Transcript_11317/g.18324 Transcript_11317/m.18324 type:complete len:440 (+) Transcript_11317:12521-13840(+)
MADTLENLKKKHLHNEKSLQKLVDPYRARKTDEQKTLSSVTDAFIAKKLSDSELLRLNTDVEHLQNNIKDFKANQRNFWASKSMRIRLDPDEVLASTAASSSGANQDSTLSIHSNHEPDDDGVYGNPSCHFHTVLPVGTDAPTTISTQSAQEEKGKCDEDEDDYDLKSPEHRQCNEEKDSDVDASIREASALALEQQLEALSTGKIESVSTSAHSLLTPKFSEEDRLREHIRVWKSAAKKCCEGVVEGKESMRRKKWWFTFCETSKDTQQTALAGWKTVINKFIALKATDIVLLNSTPATLRLQGLGRCMHFQNQIPEIAMSAEKSATVQGTAEWSLSACLVSPKALAFAMHLANRVLADADQKMFPKSARSLEGIVRLVHARYARTSYSSSPPLFLSTRTEDTHTRSLLDSQSDAGTLHAAPDAADFFEKFYTYGPLQ